MHGVREYLPVSDFASARSSKIWQVEHSWNHQEQKFVMGFRHQQPDMVIRYGLS
jgi:hypothetical protein